MGAHLVAPICIDAALVRYDMLLESGTLRQRAPACAG